MLGEIPSKKLSLGFTLIELMIVISIIGILAATSVPSYKMYLDKVRLLAGEVELVQALKDFSVLQDYSPPTGLLADLVSEGFIKDIPNDPWTSREAVSTGAEEDVDWYYSNDGESLTLYAYSHPNRKYILPSFGKAPLDNPVIVSKVVVTPIVDVDIGKPESKGRTKDSTAKTSDEGSEVKESSQNSEAEGSNEASEVKGSNGNSETKDSNEASEVKGSNESSEAKDSNEESEVKDSNEDS